MIRILNYTLCFAILFSIPLISESKKLSEKEKIQFVLDELVKIKAVFIRNDSEHSAEEARAHMERKLSYAGSRIKTVEDFIEHIASKSSQTGKPYFVKLPDGSKIESEKWIRNTLKKIE
jgi:pimeloyl-CoA synthetase